MKKTVRGIEARVLMVALAPVVATALALTLYFTLLRFNDVESRLRQRGIAMAEQLAPAAQYGLFSGNTAELKRLAQALARAPDVVAITIYGPNGQPLVTQGRALASPPPGGLPDAWSGENPAGNILAFHSKVFASSIALDDPYANASATRPNSLLLGSVTVELSRDSLLSQKKEIFLFTVSAAFVILLIAGLIARRLGRDITEPILALEHSVRQIRDGRLESRVLPHPAATLHALEEGINSMALALEAAQQRSTAVLYSTEERLQQQSNFANALIEAQSNAGVCMAILEEGKMIYANQPALEFAGRAWSDIQTVRIADILSSKCCDPFDHQCNAILRGETTSTRFEINLVTPDGIDRWSEVTAFSITRVNTRQVAMIGIDITQRKHDALKLMQAHEELRLQRDDAQRANTAKSRFLAAASHDLRQPLHALALFSDQLRERVITPEQHYLSEQMRHAISSMSELLESLMDISRTDLSTLQPEIRPVALAPLLEQVASAYWQTAADKGVRLTVAKTTLWISSDSRYLRRILSNLIANAVRYTEQGVIVLGARRAGANVRIEIWDTGIGIDNDHLPLVFQEFYQVANPERDPKKGLGLGLAIVDRLCKSLGHTIDVHSVSGKGSVFRVLAPRCMPQSLVTIPASAITDESGAHVMVAIDNQQLRTDIADLLSQWNYSVDMRSSRLELLKSPDTLPDLIISDKERLGEIQKALSLVRSANIPIVAVGDSPMTIAPDEASVTCMVLPLKPAKLRALLLHLLAA